MRLRYGLIGKPGRHILTVTNYISERHIMHSKINTKLFINVLYNYRMSSIYSYIYANYVNHIQLEVPCSSYKCMKDDRHV